MVKMQIIGNLTKDAVLNNVSGRSVINMTIAHNEKTKEGNSKTIYVDCAYWTDKTAIMPYLKKGGLVYADGNPDIKTYTTNDGRSGAILTLRVLSVQLLGNSNNQSQGSSEQSFKDNLGEHQSDFR
jgi:single-strand DNA-binding protein